MKLPLELVDEVIGHIPPMDKISLRNCSLVAKPWIRSSQKLLFKLVEIHPRNLRSWLDNISPTSHQLLGQVRRLSYNKFPEGVAEPVHHALQDYLSSLRQLMHLALFFGPILPRPQQIGPFSAFQHTLSEIPLGSCRVT